MKMEQKIGDILIFEAEDNWISKSIALLTQSNVSHSAMVYDAGKMVEMGSKGIAVSTYRQDEYGEAAYLLRLSPEQDGAKLAQAARHYVDANIKYDFPDLVILGGLLIYRLVRPTPRWQRITDLILNAACAALDKLLLHLTNNKGGMICSQLVYQCYYDCGESYRLRLRGTTPAGDMAQSDCAAGPGICLAQIVESGGFDAATLPQMDFAMAGQPDAEALAMELYEALDEAQTADYGDMLAADYLSGTAAIAARFLDIMEKILEQAHIDLPVPAMFVTPSDILNAENLNQYGNIKVERVSK